MATRDCIIIITQSHLPKEESHC